MISAEQIAEAVAELIPKAACTLRPDVLRALEVAVDCECSSRGRAVLGQLIENARLARERNVPLCQDTGTVWVHIGLGVDDAFCGDVPTAVNAAVAAAYESAGLRMSLAHDALFNRENTRDNTPAFIDLAWRPGTGATVTVMLKGGGSDNASCVGMLEPGAGLGGVRELVLRSVSEKATGACPPLIIGVGVGATFDKVGSLAKRALLREVGSAAGLAGPVAGPAAGSMTDPAAGSAHTDAEVRVVEAELLRAVNGLGIGPAGLGGGTTALAVHIATAPCHIAALPVAVNMGCSAMRSAYAEVVG